MTSFLIMNEIPVMLRGAYDGGRVTHLEATGQHRYAEPKELERVRESVQRMLAEGRVGGLLDLDRTGGSGEFYLIPQMSGGAEPPSVPSTAWCIDHLQALMALEATPDGRGGFLWDVSRSARNGLLKGLVDPPAQGDDRLVLHFGEKAWLRGQQVLQQAARVAPRGTEPQTRPE